MENINNNKELTICKKKTMGRRKIEIKKIEKKSSLQVTFSKRRTGLFRKASEISVLCGAEIAILVQSPANKIYSYGHPSVETLLHRYQTGGAGGSSSAGLSIIPYSEDGRNKYDEAVKKLEIVKRSMKQESSGISSTRFWWDEPMEGMELYELEEYVEAMEALKDNVSRRVEEMEKQKSNAASASTSDLDPSFQINYQDFDVSNFLDFPLSCF
ncbi:PREDICTED: agamous-like MADS-box protein AGL61 [Erythranthe guttata]|uniref:agamous-like MADS-box protein AGL61 n=1 Tax=Erythranthe guttata TaxID=4155 RepID=UPI00064DB3A8|nr:PREDICTED: agamous-like MADS-box protein AGL61 [Erythranthe guttata]|eukprot:XP_012833853.1 PREDICTED: agamous-like MADS-box protein AGL61 [Erythranthe guttata]